MQGSLDHLQYSHGAPGYSPSAPGAINAPTATSGHVVSDHTSLEISLFSQVSLYYFPKALFILPFQSKGLIVIYLHLHKVHKDLLLLARDHMNH